MTPPTTATDRDGKGIEVPPGSESDKPYSKFMAIYAALCRNHMRTFGTTQRQIAAVSAKNHGHSVHNPYSQFRKSYSIDEILAAPPITYPLTLPMCAPLSDGSAAAILCTEDGLARIGADRSRCIRVAASVMRSFSNRRADQFELNLGRLAANQAYEQAGLGPSSLCRLIKASTIISASFIPLSSIMYRTAVPDCSSKSRRGRLPYISSPAYLPSGRNTASHSGGGGAA